MHSDRFSSSLTPWDFIQDARRALVGFMSEQTSSDFQLHIGEKFESRLE